MSAQVISINAAVSAPGVVLFRTDGVTPHPLSFGPSEAYPMLALHVSPVSGTISTISVQIETSFSGALWSPIATAMTNTAGGIIIAPDQFPFPFIRANVTVLTGVTPVIRVSLGAGRYFQG